jgi:hypothetical protein
MTVYPETRQVTLRLTRNSRRRLDKLLKKHRTLYNAALEERLTAWRTHQESISYVISGRPGS